MLCRRFAAIACLCLLVVGPVASAQDRDTKVRDDRKNFVDDTTWIYNDLAKGFDEAKTTGKPMLVVFR